MNSRNFQLAAVGTFFFLAGTIMLYFTSFNPDSAYAGYAVALHFGGLAVASIGINDHMKHDRKRYQCKQRRNSPLENYSQESRSHARKSSKLPSTSRTLTEQHVRSDNSAWNRE